MRIITGARRRMTRPIVVLRPEPGNAATIARIVRAGGRVVSLPLFAVRPIAWTPPDPRDHDAVLLTSANAIRLAGPGLATLTALPAYAVGDATAAAARAAGFAVAATGASDALALAATAAAGGVTRALHLAGRDRVHTALPGVIATITVYASEALPVGPAALAQFADSVALIHSPRAGRRLAELVARRADVGIVAISAAAAGAAGTGWASVDVAATPDDDALVARALSRAD